jgi:YcxB-like protein
MTVHYDLNEDDWLSMNLHYLEQSGMIQKNQRRHRMLIGVCGLEVAICLLVHWPLPAFFFGAMGAALLFNLTRVPTLLRKQIQRQSGRGDFRALFGHYELALTPEGIKTKGPISENIYYWSAVEQLVETETHFFIQFSSAVRITVPKRAFAAQTQGMEFLKLAEHYRQNATGTPIPTMQRGAWWTQRGDIVETQAQRQ